MLGIILSAMLGSRDLPTVARCDMLEWNEYRNGSNDYYKTQLIAWDWDGVHRRHNVVAWVQPDDKLERIPRRHANGRWRVTWNDGREVEASLFIKTKTEHDPERRNLMLHPERRDLK